MALNPSFSSAQYHLANVSHQVVEKTRKVVTNVPAVAKVPAADGKRLHAFTGLPSSLTTILGPRRMPAVKAPIGNSDKYLQIFTSNGFQALTNTEYISTLENLKPDIAISLADVNYGAVSRSQAKGLRRSCERTEEWMVQLHRAVETGAIRLSNTSIFAPTLQAPHEVQWEYLRRLSDDLLPSVSGLAMYDVSILPDLADYPNLLSLPRLSFDVPPDPHAILCQISLGIDTFLLPFVNTVTDAGVAMTFTFPPPTEPPSDAIAAANDGTGLLPLGTDLTEPQNITSLAPLVEGCSCYACTAHHRAYLHHLLNAREMLAWTLLQMHNHHTIHQFFTGVRASLALGAETFQEDCRRFSRMYEAALPVGMGERPRARGYHFKSEHGDEKRNPVTWQLLQEGQMGKDKVQVVEGKLARDGMDTPVVAGVDTDAEELARDGLGTTDVKG